AVIVPLTQQDSHGSRRKTLTPECWFGGISLQPLSTLLLENTIGIAQNALDEISDLITQPTEFLAIVRGNIQVADQHLCPPRRVEHRAVKEFFGCLRRIKRRQKKKDALTDVAVFLSMQKILKVFLALSSTELAKALTDKTPPVLLACIEPGLILRFPK